MKNDFTCIIVDDEEHAIGLLAASISELYSNVSIVATYSRWNDALEALRVSKPDILFLDISIGGKNGMDILTLVPGIESEVVFVTAYSEFAVDAFKLLAAGYLLKPVSQADLCHVMDRAISRITHKRLASHMHAGAVPGSKILIPNGKGFNFVDANDILYLEATNGCTKIVTSESELLSAYNIGKYNYVLENKQFFHVHRSYIVNIDYVTRYEAHGVITMTNKKEIPIARNFRDEFLNLFKVN